MLQDPEVAGRLVSEDLGEGISTVFRGGLRLHELRRAVAELRDSLERGIADEHVYQRWCQRHSWAFGMAYVDADQLRRISASDDVDLLLPSVLAELRDIVELKRPDAEVLRRDDDHRDFYWSQRWPRPRSSREAGVPDSRRHTLFPSKPGPDSKRGLA